MPKNAYAIIKDFIDEFIIEMIPGTIASDIQKAKKRYTKRHVTNLYEHRIYLSDEIHFFSITKSKPFSTKEHTLISDIIDEALSRGAFDDTYRDEISKGIIELAIAKYAGGQLWETIKGVLELYNSWSSQTYEGNRISHNIGVHLSGTPELFANRIIQFKDEDYLKILGSSYDSILTLSPAGSIKGLEILARETLSELEKLDAPISMAHIAAWAQAKKVAISLTRNGEILLFKDKKLSFAKRRGAWRYFPHELILRDTLQIPDFDISRDLRVAVYRTALDVAFSRGGACIGIVPSVEGLEACIPPDCTLKNYKENQDVYRTIIGKNKFYEISRSARAELCSVDGATVVDCKGNIICVGAILITEGNASGGGGRSAAAKRISDYGIGIKVSNDGYIELFPKGYNKLNKNEQISTEWA